MKLAATLHERVQAAARAAAEHVDAFGAEVAVVLGSGLGGVAGRLASAREIAYAALPGFPETTVAGHPGRLVAGLVAGRKALLLCGRVHGYEGYSACEVGFGVRVAAALGAGTLIVTNASGGIDPIFHPGEIVALSDHINLTGASPLTGPNDERLGPRFVDMTDAYTPALRALAATAAPGVLKRPIREAVYAGMAGPSYETPAEVRMLRALGAGVVGMSTVHEVIAARHAGMAILGLSLVANHAAGVSRDPLRHEDVTRAAAAGSEALADLVTGVIAALPARKPA
ncbi:MAG TPA: purine-nucleoside phosphorylase [Polyangia bacterium]|nr:purine-nucleoside phosphorylase [Polyangia bacterium]